MSILEALNKYLEAADVNPETLKELESFSHIKKYNPGDFVFRENQSSDHLYIVLSGLVDVQYLLPSGKRQTVDSCEQGDFLVWSAVVQPHTTQSIGICRTPTETVAIEAAPLRELCEKDPHFGYHLQRQMARVSRRRLGAARTQITDMDRK